MTGLGRVEFPRARPLVATTGVFPVPIMMSATVHWAVAGSLT